jgi:hypothetical protein
MHLVSSISLALSLAAGAAPDRTEALKDAKSSLLLPCSEEQAAGKLTKVRVIEGKEMNQILEQQKSKRAKADPQARFLAITYVASGRTITDHRQIATAYGLTTEEAQALLGAKVCVVEY